MHGRPPLAFELTTGWAANAAWRVLDTQFGTGDCFLSTWQSWRDDPHRPPMLHFVALAMKPPTLDAVVSEASHTPARQTLLNELKPHWFGLLPGFHRISLNQGRVLLTLCIGNTPELLRQQHFFADAVCLRDVDLQENAVWDVWTTKALARCCRRGTRLSLRQGQPQLMASLKQVGFVFGPSDELGDRTAVFEPRWTLKNSRNPTTPSTTSPGTCIVVGAGLAGASVAASLARRGWAVEVLDGASTPAASASGLPVGLLAPHGSADDCKLSRLSRSGVRLTLGEASRLLDEGQDWALTGSLEYRLDGSTGLPERWPAEGSEWSQSIPSTDLQKVASVWHAQAAWIKPALLVRAWLTLPNITFQANAQAASLTCDDDKWSALDAQGQILARADRVVFANAAGALPLLHQVQADDPTLNLQLERLPKQHGVRGQLSFGRHDNDPQQVFPTTPINGAGSVIPHIPTADGPTWYIGSSFQPDTQPAHSPEHNHRANFDRLQNLKPDLAIQLKPQFDALDIHHWGDTRCVTADRLPMVGELRGSTETGLWICAGMGSRGLSFSVLCAELLAAQWGGEPLPIELTLAQSFNALRAASTTTKV